ncbi:54S ribosomal protein L38 [Ceratobasidium theobromae]|uniref:Large ribosomal subunit protein uL14m n=1 Tax=Ceratobasidium theobromae TaxID=1582974 RepID=A0A5N5QE01_9AGAM|nr:54S ribosomal protein L38 [Ceratobasidium theobromae]
MLGLKATLNIIDNSGALLAECVNVLKSKSTGAGMAKVGDEIVVVIRRARPIPATALASATAIKVKKGDVRRALVVRTKKEVMRPDGRYIRFDDNAAVLLNNKKELLGTRIGGVVSADLRMKGWSKIAALAPKAVPEACCGAMVQPLESVPQIGAEYENLGRSRVTNDILAKGSRVAQRVPGLAPNATSIRIVIV